MMDFPMTYAPPSTVEIYDGHSRRRVRRVEPSINCHCGAVLKLHNRDGIRRGECHMPHCGRCNASFYLIEHEPPFMEAKDA
jgi:hypothetical protein